MVEAVIQKAGEKMTGEHTDRYLEDAIASEHDHCVAKHGPFKNHHEAYGVMKEEMEEVLDASELFAGRAMKNLDLLWLKVKDDNMTEAEECIQKIHDTAEELVKEGIQVMAMCRKWQDLINREGEPVEAPGYDAKELAKKIVNIATYFGVITIPVHPYEGAGCE